MKNKYRKVWVFGKDEHSEIPLSSVQSTSNKQKSDRGRKNRRQPKKHSCSLTSLSACTGYGRLR